MRKKTGEMGMRIESMIEALRLSVKEVAQAVRVSEGLVYDWINETRKFQPRYAQVLALLYNVSEHWLMTGQGEMFGAQGPRLPGVDPLMDHPTAAAEQGSGETARAVYWRALLDEARRERDAWRQQATTLAGVLQHPPQEPPAIAPEGQEWILDSRPLNAEEATLIRAWRNLKDEGMRHALLGTLRGEARAGALALEQTDTQYHPESRTGGKGR